MSPFKTNRVPRVLQKHDRNTVWMDECNLSIKFPAVLRQGIGRKEGRRACYFLAVQPQKSKAALDQKSWQPHIVPHLHHKWHTDTICEIDLVKAQDMCLKFYHTFSFAVVHFGDVPAECIERVVGHDRTILYERPSEVAPHERAIQEDFGASGGRLPGSRIVLIPFDKLLTEKSLKKNCFSVKEKIRK